MRANNADVVAYDATQPTSVHTFADESDRARAFALLYEAIPLGYLVADDEIRNVLSAQMATDPYVAPERTLRHRGRFEFAVLRPDAFVEIDLTAWF